MAVKKKICFCVYGPCLESHVLLTSQKYLFSILSSLLTERFFYHFLPFTTIYNIMTLFFCILSNLLLADVKKKKKKKKKTLDFTKYERENRQS
jgi:hypothetical protein